MRGDRAGGAIRWKLHLARPVDEVFRALNTDEGRASFWAESAIEKDGSIHFEFINGMSCNSRILEREPPHRFEIVYFGSVAAFELRPDDAGGTDLTLTNTGVPAEDWQEVHAGWLNVLFPLKAALVFGVDLRSHDRERTWALGYIDQ